MHDRHHIRPGAIDGAVDEALEKDGRRLAIDGVPGGIGDRVAVEIESEQVGGSDQRGRHAA